jgi:hypothetical protein
VKREPLALTVALIAFATHRVNRAWHVDSISEPLRDKVETLADPVMIDGTDQVNMRQTAIRLKAYDLLTCPYCTGFWIAGLFTVWALWRRWRAVWLVWWAASALHIVVQDLEYAQRHKGNLEPPSDDDEGDLLETDDVTEPDGSAK